MFERKILTLPLMVLELGLMVVYVCGLVTGEVIEPNLRENPHERVLNGFHVLASSLDFYQHPADYQALNHVRFYCMKVNDTVIVPVKRKRPDLRRILDFNYPIVLLFHSYMGHDEKPWIQAMTRRLTTLAKNNACIVNWSTLANLELALTVLTLKDIGAVVANFVRSFKPYTSLSDVSFVGYGLGAHVAGCAGSSLKGEVGKIFGLDPMFEFNEELLPKSNHLDRSDAKLVQISHTSIGVYGSYRIFGHQNFYINTGSSPQPGCEKNLMLKQYECSHFRAVELFYYALDPHVSYADTRSRDRFGFYTKGVSGDFYVKTSGAAPFVIGNGTETGFNKEALK